MMARSPDCASWKYVTCSWPVPRSKTPTTCSPQLHRCGLRESRVVAAETVAAMTGCPHERTCPVIAYAAHLRVYEPLGALPERERQHWSAYVEDGAVPSRPVLMAREHEAALAAALAGPPRTTLPVEDDQAYVRHVDGLTYVCPWRLQMRAWEALDEFRAMLPEELADAFLPR